MIEGLAPVYQALLGTLFTWALTALGSALVFLLDVENLALSRKILDGMLGFAAGVMLAASYWSLLGPAIEIAESMPEYGPSLSWFPAATGFALGALTMVLAEECLPTVDIGTLDRTLLQSSSSEWNDDDAMISEDRSSNPVSHYSTTRSLRRRGNPNPNPNTAPSALMQSHEEGPEVIRGQLKQEQQASYRRVLLLVLAITIHNFPEGMAVGVGFGSIGQSEHATYQSAVNLAIGIGLQNFPEGLAVSMPLRREGMSASRAFMWGQLSGLVEPLGGLLGAQAVVYVAPILPYALAFAAGCMIFVVVDDLIPEATQSGNQKLSSVGTIVGFLVMMIMDVALG